MWRDTVLKKILDAKKANNIKTKAIAEKAMINEKSVSRILNGERKAPSIEDVIAIGEAVGLSAIDLFAETGAVVGSQRVTELTEELSKRELEINMLRADLKEISEENATLKALNCTLSAQVEVLGAKLELTEELVETHRYYIREKQAERSKGN